MNRPASPEEISISPSALLDDQYVDNVETTDEIVEKKAPPKAKQAIKMDAWLTRKGNECLEHNRDIQKLVAAVSDDEAIQQQIVRDAFALAWQPENEWEPRPADSTRSQYLQTIEQSLEFSAIKEQTAMCDIASDIFAAKIIAGLKTVYEELPDDTTTVGAQAKVLKVAKDAITKAAEEVESITGMGQAFGISAEEANRDSLLDNGEIAMLFKKLREDPQLQSIMRLAGRYRRLAQSRQRNKTTMGQSEVSGVTLTSDPHRLIPTELALLDNPATEDLLYRKLLEGTAMGYELVGREGEARGPVVVLVDESGSMSGDPIAHAKAIALSMAWIARNQKRFCCLASFSSGPKGAFLPMPGGECSPKLLLEWLSGFIGGGTDLDVLTDTLPARWESLGCTTGKTDIICITDAGLHCDEQRAERFKEWKKSVQARLDTIVIGCDPGDMDKISERCHRIASLGVEVEEVAQLMDI